MRPEHLDLLHTPSAPTVHPDGTWAVIAIAHPDLQEDVYPSSLWRLDLADGSLRPLTHGTGDSTPVISPDGQHLAFIRAPKGDKPQLALMRTDGGEAQVLTDHPLGVTGRPEFSPDSSRIAYVARVPEQGRYGTVEDVGPGAEPPRHITRFTYRMDGVGFCADRPQHLYVIDVPVQDDPTAPKPQAGHAAAGDGGAAREGDDGADLEGGGGPAGDGGAAGDDHATGANGSAPAGAAPGADPDQELPPGARQGVPVRPVQVTSGDRDYRNPVWDHDGTHLLAICGVVDALRSEVIRVPVAAGAVVEVLQGPEHGASAVRTGAHGTVWLLAQDLGPDGMDFIGKTPALYSAQLSAEGLSDLQRRTDPLTESFNGAVFIVEEDADGAGQVLLSRYHRGSTDLVRYADGQVRPVLDGQVSVSGAAPLPSGRVLVTAATPDSAGEVFSVDAAGIDTDHNGAEPVRRLTDFSARLREQADPFIARELQVDSEDGYPVHGWVTVPEGPGPHPVLLLIHGGPYAQYESVLFDEVQVYTRAGYAVVFCNPRGSAGYGQEHGRAITGAFGDRDAADVLAFLDGALAAHPEFDAERVGVLGGSYGGYMTAWLTTRTDRFAAAIVERGFLDPVSFEGSADIGWFFGLEYLGTDPEQVAAQSPMAHIDKVTTPTLVIHSEHDWRCPVEQGQRWFVGLKRRGVQAEFLLFPGEGHELSRSGRPKHRQQRFEHILDWWQRHLPVT